MDLRICCWTALWLLCGVSFGWAQESPGKTEVTIIGAEVLEYIETDDKIDQFLAGNVQLRHDSTFLFCDTALLFGPQVQARGNTSVVQGDSLRIFSDTLTYSSETGIATLVGNVVLLNGPQRLLTNRLRYNTQTRVATYQSGAFLETDSTRMFSRRGTYYVGERKVVFRDSVRIEDARFRLQADSMTYRVDEEKAYFTGPTLINQGASRLYCESGNYHMPTQQGLFIDEAQFADTLREAVADTIFYDGRTERITLYGQAVYREADRLATGDVLDYREATGDFRIRGQAYLRDGEQEITAEGIDYNTKSEQFRTRGRSRVVDGGQILRADVIRNTDSTDLAMVIGHVVWEDTINQVILQCDSAIYQRSSGYLEAMGNPPLLRQVIDQDTLYMVADRIRSERLPGPDSARLLQAYQHVFIYKSDLQVRCDSLSYDEAADRFSFFHDPVVWSDTSQFTADTIHMAFREDQIDTIYLRKDALILNSPDELFFNQIKGRNIQAGFAENELRRMDVLGNAQAIYYVLDEQRAYVGVNASECSEMLLMFANNEIEDIYSLGQPTSIMHPMGAVDHQSIRLAGFRWRSAERPSSRADILARWLKMREERREAIE